MVKKQMNKAKRNIKNQKGITLVALVVTIVVLIILASVSISLVLGQNGILRRARVGRVNYAVAANEEHVTIASGASQIDELTARESSPQMPENPEEPEEPEEDGLEKGPNGKPLVNVANIPQTSHDKIIGEDANGNQVVVPDGFKVASDSGTTVKVGIVIEDNDGNQYVWVPVSNINHDGSNKIKVNSATEEGVEITLGRYTFDTNNPGNPLTTEGTYQYGVNYASTVTLNNYYQELKTYRQSNGLTGSTGTNTTARGVLENNAYNGIKGFIESVRDNKGYYVARYEASYRTNGKAGSKISTSSTATLALTSPPETRHAGDLWNFVSQPDAATACYDLYSTINSDLMNSYAWDTTIVYIQAMGNTNYSNTTGKKISSSLGNTGISQTSKCKIFNLVGNCGEWITEYSTVKSVSGSTNPCVAVSGKFDSNSRVVSRSSGTKATTKGRETSFRSILYI